MGEPASQGETAMREVERDERRHRVAVVTGGGAGIGAAVAEHLGRDGWFVVTVDPLLSLDGSERLATDEETTADRIVAAGGSAQASSASVTDASALEALFGEVAEAHGGLDAVVNVAGISRPTGVARGGDDDWRSVLEVHLDGYRNVLAAALPIMASAGFGRIVGVTSGSGWREADAGAYSCAKRAVAALTWQIGRHAPPGVIVNAMSPIAVTRMVTAALGARRSPPPSDSGPGAASSTGGLSLGSMPTPEQLGPFAAYLVGDEIGWCRGRVFFAGGPEVAVIDPPRLIEVVRVDGAPRIESLLGQVTARVLAPAERAQASVGGTNPRLAAADDAAPPEAPEPRSCAVVSNRHDRIGLLRESLEAQGVGTHEIEEADTPLGTNGPVARIDAATARLAAEGRFDGIVVALGRPASSAAEPPDGEDRWAEVLADHTSIVNEIHTDAAWVRAAVEHAQATASGLRAVVLCDASTGGGRSRAQAVAQLARSARTATEGRVGVFVVSVEGSDATTWPLAAGLAAHLVTAPEVEELSGAELVVGEGWIGLRSHPRPGTSVVVGEDLPPWFDATLRQVTG